MKSTVIYVMNIVPLDEDAVFESYFAKMHCVRQEKIMRFSQRMDQNRSLGAGILLAQGLLSCGIDYREAKITTDQNGKPYLAGITGMSGTAATAQERPYRNIHFCLTHSGNYAAAAFGPGPVGIDLEHIRECGEALIRRCCNEEEQKALFQCSGRDREKLFLRYWTIKESAAKWSGQGIRLPFREIRLREDNRVETDAMQKEAACFLREFEFCDGEELYRIAVCAGTADFAEELHWIKV